MSAWSTDAPEVSVVMGVRNAGAALAPTVESILTQADLRLELIVVNDGSTDGSVDDLRERLAADPRVRILEQAAAGLTRALIAGCAAARAPLLARQDAGDRSLPGRLSRQVELLAARPDAVFASCGHRLVGPAGELLAEWVDQEAVEDARVVIAGRSPHHGTVVIRREAYESCGGYRAEFYFAQDLDLWIRLLGLGRLVYAPEILYEVRFGYDSITAHYRDRQEHLRSLLRRIEDVRRRGGDETLLLAEAARVRPDGRRRRSDDNSWSAYFVGSCLEARGDRRALKYFREAVRVRPLFLRAWLRLARARWRFKGMPPSIL